MKGREDMPKIADLIQDEYGLFQLREGGVSEEEYLEDGFQSEEWLTKEIKENVAGLWDPYYEFNWELMRPVKEVLDYGAGIGWFVNFLRRKKGVHALGAEISRYLRRNAIMSAKIYHPEHPKVNKQFDVVRMALVLEHIRNPRKFLEEKLKIWKPWEILVVVPNEFNPLQRKVGGDWFISRWHWNYFTPASLVTLFKLFGYTAVYRGATFPMELFILLGFDYRGNDELGRKCHLARLRLERRVGPRIFKLYGWLHRRLVWGREMIYLFRRECVF